MKSKVDPLIKLLEFQRGEASRALMASQQLLQDLEAKKRDQLRQVEQGEKAFDLLQAQPSMPEEHALYQQWLNRMRGVIVETGQDITRQVVDVERCREALAALHLELKTLERYKDNLEERLKLEKKALDAKELDEIAGQKHRRQEI